jgi:hypothetical protein
LHVSGRVVSLGIAIALLVALAGVIVAACYEVPTPDCGFVCGPDNACPERYTCADDHRCHRIGAPAALVCSAPDGGTSASDARADSAPDARADGATVDGRPDGAIDAAPDAAIDVPVDVLDAAP